MPGKPRRAQEQMFEVLAYKPDGTFFSWYRIDANDLLRAKGRPNGTQPNGSHWSGRWTMIRHDLEQATGPPVFLDTPALIDQRLSADLLTFEPGNALAELYRACEQGGGNDLVALASLHLAVDPKSGARFARVVKKTFPEWRNNVLTEDLLTTASQAVLFLVQAPGETARTHWLNVYEGALLMMAAYCRDAS